MPVILSPVALRAATLGNISYSRLYLMFQLLKPEGLENQFSVFTVRVLTPGSGSGQEVSVSVLV